MAFSDDGWGPLEIILVIVLGIAFLTYVTGRSIGPGPIIPPKEQTASQPETARCGLNIFRPKPLEKVSEFVTIAGTVENCQWRGTVQPVLYARIVDARGIAVSRIVVIDLKKTTDISATFSSTISFGITPVTKTGYVVISHQKDMDSTLSAQVPITFTQPLD